ncbi:MAG: dihydroorotase family protein [Patescibacteria group bacterium]
MQLPWETRPPTVLPWWAIDMHVHCRDEEQWRKTTIKEVLRLSRMHGIGMIIDMPNTARPVLDRDRVRERLALVPKKEKDHYRLYVGLTDDERQIAEALWCYDNIPEVLGLKMFADESVGSLSITEKDAQRKVYRILAKQNYFGAVLVHCEKKSLRKPWLWDPSNPISHTWARPEESEVESVRDQIQLAMEEDFRGRIHICHVSCPQSVELVRDARSMELLISCGVTPHHWLWYDDIMNSQDGLIYKMNPPLRRRELVLKLRDQVATGLVAVIETDHAKHTPEEKNCPECLSGYPSMELYGQFVREILPASGLTPGAIRFMTRDNILRIFSDKLGL